MILQGRYAAALFSAANKNGSLDAVEKVSILHLGPKSFCCSGSIFYELLLLLLNNLNVSRLRLLLIILAQDLKSISSTMESDPRLGSFLLDPSIKKLVSSIIQTL